MKNMIVASILAFSAIVLILGQAPASSMDTGTSGGKYAKATFAGGCFWCMEPPYDKLEGVLSTTSGYIGGHTVNPTYEEVSAGGTGHAEAIEVIYDPSKITYTALLEVYWKNIDPTTPDRQFCDHGDQYRPELFYHTDEQRRLIEESIKKIEETKTFPERIATEVSSAKKFYPAEEYHQDYYLKTLYGTNFIDIVAAGING